MVLAALIALTTLADPDPAAHTVTGAKATELNAAVRAALVDPKKDVKALDVRCRRSNVDTAEPVSCELSSGPAAFTTEHKGAPADRLFKALVAAGASSEGAAGSSIVAVTGLSCDAKRCAFN